jgi:integrase-like protein
VSASSNRSILQARAAFVPVVQAAQNAAGGRVFNTGGGRIVALEGAAAPKSVANAERLIGSIRRDCLDHVVVFGEQHLRHLLNSYQKYYNEVRTHLSLNKDAPASRAVQAVSRIVAIPQLGGLHHRYVRI